MVAETMMKRLYTRNKELEQSLESPVPDQEEFSKLIANFKKREEELELELR